MKMYQTYPLPNNKLLNQKLEDTVRKPYKHTVVDNSWGFTFNKKGKQEKLP